MNDFTISQLAREVNVNVETIRYYERLGLVRKPPRSENGYRHYNNSDAAQLQFVRDIQALGFTLKEIKQLVILHLDNNSCCREVKTLIENKLGHIQQELQQLKTIESQLQQYAENCRSNQDSMGCPLLDTLWPRKLESRNKMTITRK